MSKCPEEWMVVQRHLGLTVDGIPGCQTANAVVEALGIEFEHQPPPDYEFVEDFKQTPNHSGACTHEGVVFHHSAGSFQGSVSWCLNPDSNVSYHCIVDTDGSRVALAKDTQRAWHAGQSEFKGRSGCNGFMLGFSFSGNTYERTLTDAEIASAVEWVSQRAEKYGWTFDWMTDHRIVSPGRKNDLNPVELERLLSALRPVFA